MKLYFITDKTSPEMKAINEILPLLGCSDDVTGIPVMLKRRPNGLKVNSDKKGYTIEFSTRASLLRAVGILVENIDNGNLCIEETPSFETLGTMPDCSRNAVHTVDTLKEWLRINALMGFNAMMLYTEDTYEIESQPHFGYMRGRFTKEEIRQIDDYADLLGIELVPNIQTLAHLATIFQWPEYLVLKDADDILIAEDERVYKLIDDMLDTCSQNFRSRRINLGMDEAFLLGSGKYMSKNGYKDRSQIMKDHMAVLMEKCRARGLEPMIWSDMFFRMLSPTNAYYDMSITKVPQKMVDTVPEGLTLVYWDYYSVNKARYDHMFERHAEFVNNKTGFAGGGACWYGVVPLNAFSVNAAKVATDCAKDKGMKQVWITLWGDDGAPCALMAVLPTLQMYAENCWSGNTSAEYLETRMKTCTGESYKAFLDMELPNNVPGRDNYSTAIGNPYKYMLYQDILSGKFDRHIPEGTEKHFADTAAHLKMLGEQSKNYSELFVTLEKLCDVLEIKSSFGIKLKKAYDENNTDELKNIAENVIPELIKRYEQYYNALRYQWDKYNKPFGFELHDVRMGGLIQRAKNAQRIILDFIEGKTKCIPELDVERIPYDASIDGKAIIHKHRWHDMVTSNIRI
ncbi:MAG: beta-N-acetylhexosaminidase [Ruminococcaceae bacterium]|nr:beta-N-acetylhexosaminidase [Oscillospiraceae bacterium]